MGPGDEGMYLHKEDRTVANTVARIQGKPVKHRQNMGPMFQEPVPEPNRSKLLGFYRSMLVEELGLGRIGVALGNMYRVSIWLKHRPFEELTKEDVIDLVEKIKRTPTKRRAKRTVNEPYAEQTVESYKMSIKKFWRWMKNRSLAPEELKQTPYPPEVAWIKRKKKKNGLLPKDIWTPEDVNRLAGVAGNLRDRAFILGLFGSGCRIGEFLPLTRKDAAFDRYSCQVVVDGKTGSRRVRLTPAASVALAGWLEVHPNKDPDAPVWVDVQGRKHIPKEHLSYDWAHKMLNDLARRAEIDKPIRPHLLRHSLATYYASRLTESVMNEHFGWEQGGRTAAVYTHLSGKQVDDQILAVFGKKKLDADTNEAVDVVRCVRCAAENTPGARQCGKCGFPLSSVAVMELLERRRQADGLMNVIADHPEFREFVKRVIRERAAQHPELLDSLR